MSSAPPGQQLPCWEVWWRQVLGVPGGDAQGLLRGALPRGPRTAGLDVLPRPLALAAGWPASLPAQLLLPPQTDLQASALCWVAPSVNRPLPNFL